MLSKDLIAFTTGSVLSHRLRSGLTALGIGIGVTAVVLLTSIGEGLHQYMLSEFTQFGTNIVAINPGKSVTFGAPSGVFNTKRPLTIESAAASAASAGRKRSSRVNAAPGMRMVKKIKKGTPTASATNAEERQGKKRNTAARKTGRARRTG